MKKEQILENPMDETIKEQTSPKDETMKKESKKEPKKIIDIAPKTLVDLPGVGAASLQAPYSIFWCRRGDLNPHDLAATRP